MSALRPILRSLYAVLALWLMLAAPAFANLALERQAVSDDWQVVRDLALSDPTAAALNDAVETLIFSRDRSGIANLAPAAKGLSHLARRALIEQNFVAADRLTLAAVQLAPGIADGYLTRSAMYWNQGNVLASASWLARGLGVGFSFPISGLNWLGYGIMAGWFATALALFSLLVPGVAQGVKTVVHRLSEMSGFALPLPLLALAPLALLMLPLAAGWGIGWSLMMACGWAWLGTGSRYRRVTLVLALLVFLGPWLCAPLVSVSTPAGGPAAVALAEVQGDLTAYQSWRKMPAGGDAAGDWRVAFALGNAALGVADHAGALSWYDSAQALGGDGPRITHNRAIAHYNSGDTARARMLFAQLSAQSRVSALTWFNQGQLDTVNLDFQAARTSFDKAQQANPGGFQALMRAGDGASVVRLVPSTLSYWDAGLVLLKHLDGGLDQAAGLWRLLFGGLSVWWAPLLLIAMLGMAWGLPRVWVRGKVFPCDMCRGTMCRSCFQFIDDLHLCPSCATGLDPARVSGVVRRLMHDRHLPGGVPLASRVLRHLIPGVSSIGNGRHGQAALRMIGFYLLLLGILPLGPLAAWGLIGQAPPLARMACAVLLAIYALLNAVLCAADAAQGQHSGVTDRVAWGQMKPVPRGPVRGR